MNKKTVALTRTQFYEICSVLENGCPGVKPNPQIRLIVFLQGNLGLRIGDVLSLKMNSFVKTGQGWCFKDFREQKTGKLRNFPVQPHVIDEIMRYSEQNGIEPDQKLVNVSVRQVQRILQHTCDYLGYEDISTHSLRKLFGTEIYKQAHDIRLCQQLFQHSSPNITARYLSVTDDEICNAIKSHVLLPTEQKQ